jgi:DNA-binding transcriptional regulator YiaG
MTKSTLKARLERLAPIRGVVRESSGSPGEFVLRPVRGAKIDTIAATLILAKRGLSMLRAKRTIEAVTEKSEIRVRLPTVSIAGDVIRELKTAGIRAVRLAHWEGYTLSVMLREMRERQDLTQEQFALKYGFEVDALQNWEQGRRIPNNRLLAAYLRVIAKDPDGAARAQEEDAP